MMTPFYAVARFLVMPLYKLLYFYRVKYEGKLPNDTPYILCPNHIQYKDPLLIAISHKKQVYFMAKHELFQHKILRGLLYALGAFPVKRGSGGKEAIQHAKKLLSQGEIVGIFMEGARSKDGKFLAPKAGAVMIALQCGVPIVPVSISCKNGKVPRLLRKITIHYGKPIPCESFGENKRENIRKAARTVMDEIKKLHKEDV